MTKKLFTLYVLTLISCNVFSQTNAAAVDVYRPLNNSSRIAIKTNLLYDAVLVPNIGAECNIYNNFTCYLDLMYAGLDVPARHFYWDLYGLQFGVRKYFGRMSRERNFSGHHAGLYGQALAYDFQAGNIGQQTPEINLAYGVEYGYSFPVHPALNIDIELGFGYMTGKYYEYVAQDGHNTWRGTIQREWIGPTKASVSLVWLIRPRKQSNAADDRQ